MICFSPQTIEKLVPRPRGKVCSFNITIDAAHLRTQIAHTYSHTPNAPIPNPLCLEAQTPRPMNPFYIRVHHPGAPFAIASLILISIPFPLPIPIILTHQPRTSKPPRRLRPRERERTVSAAAIVVGD